MWKMFRTARANLLRDSLDSSLETSWKINDISKNENGNPIEINGLINSKSNETQMKTKWTSIENKWNLIENQMKVQLKLNWNWHSILESNIDLDSGCRTSNIDRHLSNRDTDIFRTRQMPIWVCKMMFFRHDRYQFDDRKQKKFRAAEIRSDPTSFRIYRWTENQPNLR